MRYCFFNCSLNNNLSKLWVGDITRLINWRTTVPSSPTGPTALFADGTYRLRLRGWRETPGGLVVPLRIRCLRLTSSFIGCHFKFLRVD